MPKKEVTKTKICISLDDELYSKLKKHCDKNLIKVSTYINHLVKKSHAETLRRKNKNNKKS